MSHPFRVARSARYVGPFLIAAFLAAAAFGCSGGSGDELTVSDIVITAPTVWKDRTVVVNGTIRVSPGASLTLDGVDLILNPAVEDDDVFRLDDATLIARDSALRSGSGKQWNLEAYGSSVLSFERTSATDHSGIRAHGSTTLTARESELEEVQCHDDVALRILEGSAVYVVLFFVDTGTVDIPDGLLASGDGITREFSYKSTSSPASAVSGKIDIRDSDVWGFQLDLVGDVDLSVAGGTEIVLALHLADTGARNIVDGITSAAPADGTLDFSAAGNPKIAYADTQISYINAYVSGSSDVTFSGPVKVVEANVMDSARLTFGPDAAIVADLLQAYDDSTLVLDGSTLIEDYAEPSITAMDGSAVRLTNVDATTGTRVYSVDGGKVVIDGGAGWKRSMFEIDGSGSITYTP